MLVVLRVDFDKKIILTGRIMTLHNLRNLLQSLRYDRKLPRRLQEQTHISASLISDLRIVYNKLRAFNNTEIRQLLYPLMNRRARDITLSSDLQEGHTCVPDNQFKDFLIQFIQLVMSHKISIFDSYKTQLSIKNKRKEYLKILEKYYIVDIGMRYMLLGTQKIDAGHILENVVYLELLRRGYDVYVGKIDNYEVNFVAQNHKGTIYYQVALTVRDEKTLQRELRPLQAIRDHYPKVILTMDEDPEIQYDGIRRINARDWLLGLTD